jgi:hypothetical protein
MGTEHKKHSAAKPQPKNGNCELLGFIPRLSKAGTPSRSESWGGLFKDESTD